jgi:RimJ/RimL family protein N-acetyltransferase
MDPWRPFSLLGRFVRLEPLAAAHAPALAAAAAESRAHYRLTSVPDGLAAAEAWVAAALAAAAEGRAVPFATVELASGRVVGSTRFLDPEHWRWPTPPAAPSPYGIDAVEIGNTWLAQSAQRTVVNGEAKLLMLGHAFDTWRVHRVRLCTDVRNARSRAAIERLGARLDGVIRAHMPSFDGTGPRDSAFYSIIAAEWPAVRERLTAFCTRRSPSPPPAEQPSA